MTTTSDATVTALPTGSLQDQLAVLAGAVRETTAMRCTDAAVDLLIRHGEGAIAARLNNHRTMNPDLARTLILSAGLETVLRSEDAQLDEDVADPMMR